MAAEDEDASPPVRRLREQGWRQGCLFEAPAMACVRYDVTKSGELTSKQRRLKPGEKYVLVTHDCDIDRDVDLEPLVEALLCKVETRRDFLDRLEANRNSARWFVVDPINGLIAHAAYRLVIAKKLLPMLESPEPWPADAQRFSWFRWWLGYRFDRPSLEPYEERNLLAPVQEVLDTLHAENATAMTTFYHAVSEVRVTMPSRHEPPFDFQLLLLTRSPSLSSTEADAISTVLGAIRLRLDPEPIALDDEILVAAVQEIPLSEYRKTWMLPLDQFVDTATGADD